MKLKQLLTKTLLLAAGLIVGSSHAWGKVNVVYGRAMTADAENGYTAWSNNDVAASGTATNIWIGNFAYNEDYGLYASGNGNRNAVMTFEHTNNSIQTFDIVYNNRSNTGDSGNYSYIRIGSDIEIQSNQQNQNGAVIINGNSAAISNCNQNGYNRGGDSWTIHIEVNTAKKTVTALNLVGTTMNGKSANYTLAKETALSSSATFNTVAIGFVRIKGAPSTALTSIKISEEEQTVTEVDYTINYQLNGNTVKTVSGKSIDDAVITADAAIDGTEEGYIGNHYLVIAESAPSITLDTDAAENILNVPVRSPYTATLRVTKNINSSSAVTNTVLTETDSKVCNWSFAYPQYEKYEGVYYACDENEYVQSGTFENGQTIERTITYTTAEPDIIYFSEAESTNGANAAYSSGAYGSIAAQGYWSRGKNLGDYAPAVYSVTANVIGNVARGLNVRTVPTGTNTGADTNNSNSAIIAEITATGVQTTTFLLAEEKTLVLNGRNSDAKTNQSLDFDYILIRKVADITDASNEFVGAFDNTTAENGASSSDIILKDGDAYRISFQNHGSTGANKNHFIVNISNGGNKVASMYADWYDYTNDKGRWDYYFTNPYCANGGTSGNTVDWGTFSSEMKDITVTLNISYLNGVVNIIGTAPKNSNTYYWNYSYGTGINGASSLSGDVTINLSVCLAWLEILSVEQTAVGVSTTAAGKGYATFSSTKAVDFTNVEGLTAFIATGKNGNGIRLQAIEGQVAAGTGLVLKSSNGGAATFSIPTVASGTTYNTESDPKNYLFAISSDYDLSASDNGTNYVLSLQDGSVVFAPITNVAAPVTAGHAALWLPAENNETTARFLNISFDDEASAIKSIAKAESTEKVIYNLKGQRMLQAAKGLYIVDGKKMIVK